MNFLARVITKRSIKEVLKVIETYFLGPTNDLIFGSISPLVLGGVGIPKILGWSRRPPQRKFQTSSPKSFPRPRINQPTSFRTTRGLCVCKQGGFRLISLLVCRQETSPVVQKKIFSGLWINQPTWWWCLKFSLWWPPALSLKKTFWQFIIRPMSIAQMMLSSATTAPELWVKPLLSVFIISIIFHQRTLWSLSNWFLNIGDCSYQFHSLPLPYRTAELPPGKNQIFARWAGTFLLKILSA
jgi:hypothetical protein